MKTSSVLLAFGFVGALVGCDSTGLPIVGIDETRPTTPYKPAPPVVGVVTSPGKPPVDAGVKPDGSKMDASDDDKDSDSDLDDMVEHCLR